MDYQLIDLNDEQLEDIESRLEEYDRLHMPPALHGYVRVGVTGDGRLIAGADGCMTAHRILYVSTVFVDEEHRGRGVGRMLMSQVEQRAVALGANMIRLDTFDWQGAAFYRTLGYEQVGGYTNEEDGFSEYFFIKRLRG